jgi:predicted metal-binding membrane protein
VLRRKQLAAVLSALVGITALAWIHLARLASSMAPMPMDPDMPGLPGTPGMPMDMPGMLMGPPGAMGLEAWGTAHFAAMLAMWTVMMVGMMVPTALPMTLIYMGIVRSAKEGDAVVAPTLVFVAGYVGVWALFSVLATTAQWALESAALLSPMMVATSPMLGAGLLVLAGVYQLTPAKHACLSHCRSPVHFVAHHWRQGNLGALRMGASHGLYCLGCCWALMLLLFVGGVMNLLWIAAIAFFVLLEKVLPLGRVPTWVAGVAMIGAGLALLIRGAI